MQHSSLHNPLCAQAWWCSNGLFACRRSLPRKEDFITSNGKGLLRAGATTTLFPVLFLIAPPRTRSALSCAKPQVRGAAEEYRVNHLRCSRCLGTDIVNCGQSRQKAH
jgi:hypothetical protein